MGAETKDSEMGMNTSSLVSLGLSDRNALRKYVDSFLGKPYEEGSFGPATYSCFGLAGVFYRGLGLLEFENNFESLYRAYKDSFSLVVGDPKPLDLLHWPPSDRNPRGHVAIVTPDLCALEAHERVGVISLPLLNATRRGRFEVKRCT